MPRGRKGNRENDPTEKTQEQFSTILDFDNFRVLDIFNIKSNICSSDRCQNSNFAFRSSAVFDEVKQRKDIVQIQ